jgi:hypothetical protein
VSDTVLHTVDPTAPQKAFFVTRQGLTCR